MRGGSLGKDVWYGTYQALPYLRHWRELRLCNSGRGPRYGCRTVIRTLLRARSINIQFSSVQFRIVKSPDLSVDRFGLLTIGLKVLLHLFHWFLLCVATCIDLLAFVLPPLHTYEDSQQLATSCLVRILHTEYNSGSSYGNC